MADVHIALDVADAVAFLGAHPGGALPVAGGTDLLLDRRLGRVDPEWLVDLTRVDALCGIATADDGDGFRIGALTTIRSIELDPELSVRASALVDAARVLGSVQVRTMATLGGNLCHATPSAEMPPALLVLGARAEIAGRGGARTVELARLFAGPGATTLAPDELLTAARVDALPGTGSCYLRQTVRWSMDLAGVGVAAAVRSVDGTIVEARVALGAVAPVPLLAPDAAALVVGAPFDSGAAARAGSIAAAACSPITDARGTAEYRRTVVAVLVARAVRIAWLRATGAHTGPVPPHGLLPGDGRPATAPPRRNE